MTIPCVSERYFFLCVWVGLPRLSSAASVPKSATASLQRRPICQLGPSYFLARRRCSSGSRRSGCVWERSPSNRLPRQPHLAVLGPAARATLERSCLLPQRRAPARALWRDVTCLALGGRCSSSGPVGGRHDSVREPHPRGHRRLGATFSPPPRRRRPERAGQPLQRPRGSPTVAACAALEKGHAPPPLALPRALRIVSLCAL